MDNDQDREYLRYIDDMILFHIWTTLIAIGYFQLRTLQSNRRWWIRPINLNARERRGHYRLLFQRMRAVDPEQFFAYCRMTPKQFDGLLLRVRPFLLKASHRALKTSERLALTLRYLAHGGSMKSVAWEYGSGESTASPVIIETCNAIWNALSAECLLKPDKDKWSSIAEGFYTKWNLPNCIGAIDGKLVNIQCPGNGGTLFYSYKKVHAITLMAACDSNYRFTMVDIGGYGSLGDRTVFRESAFGSEILNGTLDIPGPRQLPHSNVVLPHFFVGDEAFPLGMNLMRPYPGRLLDEDKRVCNYRLSRARRTIENAFGILVSRWRIFRGSIIAHTDTVDCIIKATVCLHNYLKMDEEEIPCQQRRYCPPAFIGQEHDSEEVINEDALLVNINQVGSNNAAVRAIQVRDALKDYLVSPEGAVEWQYRHVRRGIIL